MKLQEQIDRVEAHLGKETMLRALMGDERYDATVGRGEKPEIHLSTAVMRERLDACTRMRRENAEPGVPEWERRLTALHVAHDLLVAAQYTGPDTLPDVAFPILEGLAAADQLGRLRTFASDVVCKALEISGAAIVTNAGTNADEGQPLEPGQQRNMVMMTGEELHKAAEPFLDIINTMHDEQHIPGAHIFAALLYAAGAVCGFERIELDPALQKLLPMIFVGKADALNAAEVASAGGTMSRH